VLDNDRAATNLLDDFLERLDAAMEQLSQSNLAEAAPNSTPGDPVETVWVVSDPAPRPDETGGAAVCPVASWPDRAGEGDLVERVAARVLQLISEGVVRDTVIRVVSPLAERLVREEFARVKAEIERS
jgi:hypothetical protein